MTAKNPAFRLCLAAAFVVAGASLPGCATMNQVSSQVASYGEWPAGKPPGTYSFERLPSQSRDAQRTGRQEAAAGQALQAAGFKPAAEGARGEVTVQIGARIDRTEPDPWSDPFWMPGLYQRPFAPWYRPYGPFWRPWGPPGVYDYSEQYQREVALLIRDAESGKALYEARAVSNGATEGGERTLAAMFLAAMKDFPQTDGKAHPVTTELPLAPRP